MRFIDRNDELCSILNESPVIMEILKLVPYLELPDWYLGSGAIAQTVWNYYHDFEPTRGIKDYDLVYFDPDTSYEAEDVFIKKGEELFKNIKVPVEIRNQARVHLWYKNHFGSDIEPYPSVESAIDTWPTTSTAIGIKKDISGQLSIYTPFGVNDLLDLTIRPNKKQITEEIYLKKVNRWKEIWPKLKIIPWSE